MNFLYALFSTRENEQLGPLSPAEKLFNYLLFLRNAHESGNYYQADAPSVRHISWIQEPDRFYKDWDYAVNCIESAAEKSVIACRQEG